MTTCQRSQLISCRTEGCEQVVGRISPGGIVRAFGDDIKLERGRLTVTCPVCQKRNRLPSTVDSQAAA